MITKPQLPPKQGYVEVEIEGVRKYKNVETGKIYGEDKQPETKLKELSEICNNLIYQGADITLSDGTTKHFTYTLQDQANVSEMFTAVMAGATQYPYHADNESCMIYSAQDIIIIYSTLSGMKTAQITYQNQLKQYVKSLANEEDVKTVIYGQPLADEYLETYNLLVEQARAQLNTVLSKITGVLKEG